MDKIEWYQMLNKAMKGDKEAIEFVKANQLEMNAKFKKQPEKPKKKKKKWDWKEEPKWEAMGKEKIED